MLERLFLCKNYCLFGFLGIALLLTGTPQMYAQENSTSSIHITLSYGICFPASDLKDRFGQSFALGFGTELMTSPSSLLFGFEGFFEFGSKVNEDVLQSLRTENGQILGVNSQYADVFFRKRGLNLSLLFGKVFPFNDNRKSGLRVTIAPGVYRHRIRIQDESRSLPQVEGAYQEGYDRMSSGFAIKEFIGYQYMSLDRKLNILAGIELLHAWTQNRRAHNFDTKSSDDMRRFDQLVNFKLGLIIPIYLAPSGEVRYY